MDGLVMPCRAQNNKCVQRDLLELYGHRHVLRVSGDWPTGVDYDIRAARRNREFQKRWRSGSIAVGPRGRAHGATVMLKPFSLDDVRGCLTALRR
eukprot:3172831-Pleurochrysis_carterae.AAC.1